MSNGNSEEQAKGQWTNAQHFAPTSPSERTTTRHDAWSDLYIPHQDSSRHNAQATGDFRQRLDSVQDSLNHDHEKPKSWTTRPANHFEHGGIHVDANGAPLTTNTNTSISRSSQGLLSARGHIGLKPTAPVAEEHDIAVYSRLRWSKVRLTLREPFAEFFGVLILVLFGDGAVAQVLLSKGEKGAPGGDGFGDYTSIAWGWGIGVMLGVYVAGDSGAYLNPAVTFTNCLLRKLPWRRLPAYILAQFLGGLVAAGIIYANYINAINAYEGQGIRTVPPSATATAGIFCTYPQAYMTKVSMFFSEFIASSILMFVIFALKDDTNNGASRGGTNWFPLGLFFLVYGIGTCFGVETGYAINLARDFGPRVMSYAVGYGHDVWSAGGYYFWIPMVAPFCGCVFGGVVYDVFVYTGPSPINSPWLGLRDVLHPGHTVEERVQAHKREGLV